MNAINIITHPAFQPPFGGQPANIGSEPDSLNDSGYVNMIGRRQTSDFLTGQVESYFSTIDTICPTLRRWCN